MLKFSVLGYIEHTWIVPQDTHFNFRRKLIIYLSFRTQHQEPAKQDISFLLNTRCREVYLCLNAASTYSPPQHLIPPDDRRCDRLGGFRNHDPVRHFGCGHYDARFCGRTQSAYELDS